MQTNSVTEESSANEVEIQKQTIPNSPLGIEMALLTGCQDRHYAFGLAMALVSKGVYLDVIGSDEIDSPELHNTPNLRFLNFRGGQSNNANFVQKLWKLLVYYAKLIRYAARSRPRILHILWNYKLELFDRTILMLYYKVAGKQIVFTAHNVNQAKRDSKDSWLNRTTLKIQYRLCDHIFVHTQKMKRELCQDFDVAEKAVTVIRYPVNNAFADTELTPADAKRRLGLRDDEKAILFLGRIVPYKGIEYLLQAFRLLLADKQAKYRLIVAGEPKKGSEAYLHEIERSVKRNFDQGQVILRMQFIPDDEMELYLKGADVLVLPYKEIFQSGVLFLAYPFGLPVVATDVGSFREDIVEGSTGFLCKPGDQAELAKAIETYFRSDLYKNSKIRRRELKDYANANHSWHAVAELTCNAYAKMLSRNPL
ncbi:MAG: glycosyltransferase family 4 protein [Acidobacteriia bacterium]|nr:glycosyltransferase family 4 protein [Terriglobia bacterium]